VLFKGKSDEFVAGALRVERVRVVDDGLCEPHGVAFIAYWIPNEKRFKKS